jgi:hypothetical protein
MGKNGEVGSINCLGGRCAHAPRSFLGPVYILGHLISGDDENI